MQVLRVPLKECIRNKTTVWAAGTNVNSWKKKAETEKKRKRKKVMEADGPQAEKAQQEELV